MMTPPSGLKLCLGLDVDAMEALHSFITRGVYDSDAALTRAVDAVRTCLNNNQVLIATYRKLSAEPLNRF